MQNKKLPFRFIGMFQWQQREAEQTALRVITLIFENQKTKITEYSKHLQASRLQSFQNL